MWLFQFVCVCVRVGAPYTQQRCFTFTLIGHEYAIGEIPTQSGQMPHSSHITICPVISKSAPTRW